MAAARAVTTTTLKSQIRYEIRDTDTVPKWTDAELLVYINKCSEVIYEILVHQKSELIRTGTGSLATVAGTQSYDLAANTMGDLWVPDKIWASTYEPMEECVEEDLWDGINAEESGDTARALPEEYCIVGDYLWFKDVPDDAYTIYLRYFPNFVPLGTGGTLPYKNLFNQEIVEGVKVLAKHRSDKAIGVDAILKDIFHERAMKVMYARRKKPMSITPRMK